MFIVVMCGLSAVFDATTDAQVLKTMLAREGLMREMDFATVGRE